MGRAWQNLPGEPSVRDHLPESARPSPFLGRKVCSGSFCSLGRYGVCPIWWILSFKKARKPAKSPWASHYYTLPMTINITMQLELN